MEEHTSVYRSQSMWLDCYIFQFLIVSQYRQVKVAIIITVFYILK